MENKAKLTKELAKLEAKADAMRTRQMESYRNGSASRARTTTYNRDITMLQERIVAIRQELKSLEVTG